MASARRRCTGAAARCTGGAVPRDGDSRGPGEKEVQESRGPLASELRSDADIRTQHSLYMNELIYMNELFKVI